MPQPLGVPIVPSKNFGQFSSLSDIVTIDVPFPEGLSKYLLVGIGGHLVYENRIGNLQFILNAPIGVLLPVVAKQIVTSGFVRGIAQITTAQDITWFGGYD